MKILDSGRIEYDGSGLKKYTAWLKSAREHDNDYWKLIDIYPDGDYTMVFVYKSEYDGDIAETRCTLKAVFK